MRLLMMQNGVWPEWPPRIVKAYYVIGLLFGLYYILDESAVISWIWNLAILGIFYIIYRIEDFQRLRSLMYAFLPLMVLEVLQEATHLGTWKWLNTLEGYLENAQGFAIIWLIAMFIIISRQNKALRKVEMQQKVEEKLKEIAVSQKAELEVLVAQRTAEITKQKEELQKTVEELRATQAQLIQSEKMASLGELTAGIAHEIQNPLNFVNNFSEVNAELLEELEHEIDKGNLEEIRAIARDIKGNETKINHHGKRADAIVKGMLQHSRTGSGSKELTDVNDLADEYLRLAYHGLRAKDKSFNATMKTDFDTSFGLLNVVPQDLGRVILNLITNAFYAVSEKKKLQPQGYEPIVSVSTKKIKNRVEIRVADNGMGIPQKVMDKIFQPFFTTKPTGEGTGLGLSMSYDIITKGHGGELLVKTREGEFAEFIIKLPV
ncbi:sensor histidine kinase [Flavihumibacter fluvii]|uniref:sensor histidine kinase n=1 Tax=Flavihumibacter fluvii TaxID=2838157 RepID=UPI001EFABD43|nr:ATP-binding protein [Flavihumibacter fluvii]ULQ52769.1 ATP-binding protein [Flavihumibacter fluvii]